MSNSSYSFTLQHEGAGAGRRSYVRKPVTDRWPLVRTWCRCECLVANSCNGFAHVETDSPRRRRRWRSSWRLLLHVRKEAFDPDVARHGPLSAWTCPWCWRK
jgi:hypothetical protein